MQGRVPGVEITQQTGVPGGGFTVQIRGRNSINTFVKNDPLYLIDGVPYPSEGISANTSNGILSQSGASPLSLINPYDIQSIEVLKDADATAIYGSRGANGVILITTKKGNQGKTKLTLGITQGFSQVGHRLDLLNTREYLQMRREAFQNDGLTPSSTDYDVNGTWDQNKYIDWQKELIGGTANTTNASLNITGGDEKSNYVLAGNYYKEGTVFPGDFGFDRAATHLNINLGSVKDRFNAIFTASYSHAQSNLTRSDVTSLILLPPNAPDPYDEFGKLNWANKTVYSNPMARLLITNNAETDNLIGNFILSYHLLKNLVLKTSVGYTKIQRTELAKTPLISRSTALTSTATNRISDFSNNYNNSLIAEPQITYNANIGAGKIDAIFGASFQDNKMQYRTIKASGFNSDELMEDIGSASLLSNSSISYLQYRYTALFARVNYNLRDKYLLNLTARRDGSSRFGDGKQFANFGAVGAAWLFSNEKLISDNLPFLSFGKLRMSYGITGNDQIGDYGYLQLWRSLGTYQGISTISSTRIANPDFAWETNRKAEAALQLGLFKNKINIEVSFYRNRSSNQLVGLPLPLSTGNGSIQANLPATVQNTGWEFTTDFKVLRKKDWRWSAALNLTIPRNKLVSYPGGLESSGYRLDYIIGQPLSIRRIYNVRDVNNQTGMYDIEDKNGNGVLDADDRYVTKFLGQKYYGGLQNSIGFKQFSLDFLFAFTKQTGNNYLEGTLSPGYFDVFGPTNNQLSAVFSRWQKPGDQTSIQKFSTTSTYYSQFSRATGDIGGYSIVDASFIRLKNLSIAYDLPKNWAGRLKIANAKISLTGQNIFTITKYIGLDPETQSMNILPPLRSLSLGLNLTF